jgi:uncharacterized protein (TIGR03435 family)
MRWVSFWVAAFCAYGQHFEVASVKANETPLGTHIAGTRVSDPGHFERTYYPLAGYVTLAYRLQGYQLVCPSWMFAARYDIAAKIPEGAAPDEQWVMLQNLLAERFALKVHRENQEMTGYALVIAKGGPKFKQFKDGDPLPPLPPSAVEDPEGFLPPQGGMAWWATVGGAIREQTTMAALTLRLQSLVRKPVHDETGLEGKYNLALRWGEGPTSAEDAVHDMPDAATGLFSALQSQLGLKLESKKGMVEMLVVDRCEKVPTEN